uniref:Uncharacterized protein n=1 Tax=Rhizophora mucronata TaxID=61149 RepID=A0A2P2M552_RHIMU
MDAWSNSKREKHLTGRSRVGRTNLLWSRERRLCRSTTCLTLQQKDMGRLWLLLFHKDWGFVKKDC